MNELDYSKLFQDPEFTPTQQSIYKEGDVPEYKSLFLLEKLKKVEWFRPQQIAPKFDLIGFTKSAKLENIQSLEEAHQQSEEDLVDGQRIYQGEVEDKWFLNALSMAAVEPSVFKKVCPLSPAQMNSFARYGLYIFAFLKQG